MDVSAKIAEARRALEDGHDKRASKLLDEAVYDTWDLDLLTQIRDLVLEEEAKRGHELRFGAWHDISAEANVRIARLERERTRV